MRDECDIEATIKHGFLIYTNHDSCVPDFTCGFAFVITILFRAQMMVCTRKKMNQITKSWTLITFTNLQCARMQENVIMNNE